MGAVPPRRQRRERRQNRGASSLPPGNFQQRIDAGEPIWLTAVVDLADDQAIDAGLAAAAPGGYDVIVDFLWGGPAPMR
jgi:hypothetical protein